MTGDWLVDGLEDFRAGEQAIALREFHQEKRETATLTGNEKDFITTQTWDGWVCYHKDHDWAPDAINTKFRGFGLTEAEAIQDYRESNDDECECGGTLDEYDRCDSCDSGHDDCDANECFPCLERAIGRAESMAEGMER